jgi:hypothetical protein
MLEIGMSCAVIAVASVENHTNPSRCVAIARPSATSRVRGPDETTRAEATS